MNIYDIAKKADVSIATVSRVLNGSPKVSQKTRNVVMSVINHNNYVPSAIAQNLSMQNSFKNIGIVCYDLEDIYYTKAVSLIEQPLRKQGYNIILTSTGSDLQEKIKSMELLVAKQVDAIILIGSVFVNESQQSDYMQNIAAVLPVLIINGKLKHEQIYSFYCDDRHAVYRAANALMRTCRNLIYLYDAETYSGNAKIAGFEKAIAENTDCKGTVVRCNGNAADTRALFIDLYGKDRSIDGIITANDVIAAGVLGAATQLNITVPDSLKVIGYNNSMISECTYPRLTSIDNKIESICSAAVDTLIRLFHNEKCENLLKVDADICYRETFTDKQN